MFHPLVSVAPLNTYIHVHQEIELLKYLFKENTTIYKLYIYSRVHLKLTTQYDSSFVVVLILLL